MAKPYSLDLRERVIEAIEAGHTQSEAAQILKIGLRTVNGYVKRWRTTGSVEAAKFGGYKTHKLAEHADKVWALVKAEPDATIPELKVRLEQERIVVSVSAIQRFLRVSKITYKKNAVRHRAKTSRRR